MKCFATLVLLTTLTAWSTPQKREGFEWKAIESIAIQDRGRMKPLQTFAEETALFVTGKRSWKEMSATEVVFSWLTTFEKEWEDEPFIRIDYEPLKEKLSLPKEERYFSPKRLSDASGLSKIVREAAQKEQRKERASELEKRAMQVQNQRGIIEAIVTGQAWGIFPNTGGTGSDWFTLANLAERNDLNFTPEQLQKITAGMRQLLTSYNVNDASRWNEAASSLSLFLRSDLGKKGYPTVSDLSREIHYNHLRPFRWSWVLYATAFVLLLVFSLTNHSAAKFAGLATLLGAFGLHAYGFTLRCLISGRPPVTNMYESIIWVTWGCVLFSLLIWSAYKNYVIPTAATVFAIVGLILADNLPNVLDPGIHPLEPVLRSNYWLTIHVLTITLSYAAFALSLCLGNVVLGNYFFRPKNAEAIQQYSLYMYRAVQVGVILLAAGTILGGIWADYSWGRFWGWDPKEVWALIALLLYLAVLHGRFAGWLQGFGFVTATVVSFLGVLMAWYGVNFVLGVGLHSYGFGTGGLPWVLAYVLAQLGFVGAAFVRFKLFGVRTSTIFPKGTTR